MASWMNFSSFKKMMMPETNGLLVIATLNRGYAEVINSLVTSLPEISFFLAFSLMSVVLSTLLFLSFAPRDAEYVLIGGTRSDNDRETAPLAEPSRLRYQ